MLLAMSAAWVLTGTPGGAASDPGQGQAAAFTEAVVPKDGSLAVGVTVGEALAGHTNEQAKGQSQSLDLGSIGTSLTSSDCGKPPSLQPDQIPQPLIVETGQPGASAGVTQSDLGGSITKFAKATTVPYAQAVVTSAPLGLQGVLGIGGGTSTAWSGIVNGIRQAGATTDIGTLTLPGGIALSGLEWRALDQSTGKPVQTGTFSIGHASIAGAPIPTNDPSATLSQLNTLLNPLGITLQAPKSHTQSGVLYVDPLQLSVVPNATRDNTLNPIINGIQPQRKQLYSAVLQAYCQADTEITVSDIAIASVTGGGSFNIDLGGVQASSGDLSANGFNLGSGGTPGGGISLGGSASNQPPVASPAAALGSLGGSSGGGYGGGLSSSAPAAPAPGPSTSVPASPGTAARPVVTAIEPASAIKGKRGGALALVGLGGLALLGLVAEGDRRKMRRAQRTVTFEE